jgi:threonyl-tRNA synthetase
VRGALAPTHRALAATAPAVPKTTVHYGSGARLDLFESTAQGTAWRPRGVALLARLEAILRGAYEALGFEEVRVPAGGLAPSAAAELQSYRDLPLRRFQLVRRDVAPRVTYGLIGRERTADEAIVFCERAHVEAEVAALVAAFESLASALGCTVSRLELVGAGDDGAFARALGARDAFVTPRAHHSEEARLELHLGAGGRSWPTATIRTSGDSDAEGAASYRSDGNLAASPTVVRASLLGDSLEGVVALLLEANAGFPVWLAPEQVRVLPVGGDQRAYAEHVSEALAAAGLRASVHAGEPLPGRIRDAELAWVSRIVVVGAREAAAGTVSVRGGEVQGLEAFLDHLRVAAQPPRVTLSRNPEEI